MYFLIISLVLLISWILTQPLHSKSKKLPPGPRRLPIIRNLHNLGKKPHQSLAELAKIHGPIMSLKLGGISTIVISSSSAAKEALHKQDLAFSTRHIPDATTAHNHSLFSVVLLPVAGKWKTLRKFMTTNIFSTSRLDANQHLRSKKINDLIAYCKKCCQAGEAVDVGRAAFTTSLNLLSNTIFSKDLADPFQESAKEFKEVVSGIMVEAGKPNLVDYFPALKKIDPQGIRKRIGVHFGKILNLFDGLINERMESRKLIKADGSGDVLDSCMNISQHDPEVLNSLQIQHMFLDLFVAGTDTTSSTIEWAMTELLRNPIIMSKAKAELEQVIGKGNMLEEANVSQLPYLQCIVKETLRIHSPVPFLIPRKVESDMEINGFVVPKDSQVLINVWAIGRDPSDWKDPLDFNPERFLNSEVDVRGRDFELIPFGAGRRICPGLSMAIRVVPVMVGSLINSFDWKLEGGIGPNEVNMEERFGITLLKDKPLRAIPVPLS